MKRLEVSVPERLADRVLVVDESVMTMWARLSAPDVLPAYDGLIAATALLHGWQLRRATSAIIAAPG